VLAITEGRPREGHGKDGTRARGWVTRERIATTMQSRPVISNEPDMGPTGTTVTHVPLAHRLTRLTSRRR